MKKLFYTFLVFLFALMVVSSAYAVQSDMKSGVWYRYTSLADLVNGKTDFSNARYYGTQLTVWINSADYTNIPATQEYMDLRGTFTINSGDYIFIQNGKVVSAKGGTTFELVPDMSLGDSDVSYAPGSDDKNIKLISGPDGGLNSADVSWTFPGDYSYLSQSNVTLPTFKTTAEQLTSFIPYVELTLSDDNSTVTGFKWRLVKSPDLTTAISFDREMRVRLTSYHESISSRNFGWQTINSGVTASGDCTLTAEITSDDIYYLRVRIMDVPENKEYEWRFFNPDSEVFYLWVNHRAHISLDKDNKPHYESAKFAFIHFDTNVDNVPVESDDFVKGSITLPASSSSYNVVEYRNLGKVLETVSAGTTKTFTLATTKGFVLFNRSKIEHRIYSGDVEIEFAGSGAETGFNGRNVAINLPSLGWNGETITLPAFKSVRQQLQTYVPYIELTSSDGKLKGVKTSFVLSSDVTKTGKPADFYDFSILVCDKDNNEIDGTDWTQEISDDVTFSPDIPASEVDSIRVRYRRAEPTELMTAHQWNFYVTGVASEDFVPVTPDSSDTDSDDSGGSSSTVTPGSSGGGCMVGSSALALAALGMFMTLKRSK